MNQPAQPFHNLRCSSGVVTGRIDGIIVPESGVKTLICACGASAAVGLSRVSACRQHGAWRSIMDGSNAGVGE